MKWIIPVLFLGLCSLSTYSQEKEKAGPVPGLDQFLGIYHAQLDSTSTFIIKKEDGHLILVVPGQGQAPMDWIAKNQFRPKYVKPQAIVEFLADGNGRVDRLLWNQEIQLEWLALKDPEPDSLKTKDSSGLSEYEGRYKLKTNASTLAIVKVREGGLTIQVGGEGILPLSHPSKDRFVIQNDHLLQAYEFRRDRNNRIEKIVMTRKGGIDFLKSRDSAEMAALNPHISNRQNGFTAADTLRGMLTELRTCYDVSFYHLDLEILPETKSLRGSTLIRFRTLNAFNKIQVDLYANMKIDSIIFHGHELPYTRSYDAVFIQFPATLHAGDMDEILIYYSGRPQVPDLSIPMKGGFIWYQNQEGKLWIQSVVQGSGASLWWPCKDHLSDKPDSMQISVTVPSGLMDISNGRLLAKTELAGKRTRFDWWVSYPINNYNVAINVGDYTQFTDEYIRGGDTLHLRYYCMPYNLNVAKKLFSEVKPMLQVYEKDFGPYPFERDGFVVMESLYPMEHQSAVSIGQIQKDPYDSLEMRRLMWHESAHEWWGNSITCRDMADFWIHEAFATYSEYLNIEARSGEEMAILALNKQEASNKEPVIGEYQVNDIHRDIGDLYSKGSLMLNTLRHLIDNDSTWFDLLRGLQSRFRYQAIGTEEITRYVKEKTGRDYNYFFDQYLRQASIPELELKLSNDANSLWVQYKWNETIPDFHMPVRITRSKNHFDFIEPSDKWQKIRLDQMQSGDFAVDRQGFYIRVKVDKQ